MGKEPRNLKLTIFSHSHIDHFGELNEVYQHSKAPIACHQLDFEKIKHGSKTISTPITRGGKILKKLAHLSLPHIKTKGVEPHLLLNDGADLSEFGLEGKIVHTPGHTQSSISLVLENEIAFTGDLVMGKTIANKQPSHGAFADSLTDLYQSWLKILKAGAKVIFPAHGRPFQHLSRRCFG